MDLGFAQESLKSRFLEANALRELGRSQEALATFFVILDSSLDAQHATGSIRSGSRSASYNAAMVYRIC